MDSPSLMKDLKLKLIHLSSHQVDWEFFIPQDRRVQNHQPFNSCHKSMFRNFPSVIRTHLIRASGDPRFMFVVYGSDLIVKVWLVCIVGVLDVFGFSGQCSWSFLVVPLYLSFCICHLSKRHMMSVHVWSSSVFVFIIVMSVTSLSFGLCLFLFGWKWITSTPQTSPDLRIFLFCCNKNHFLPNKRIEQVFFHRHPLICILLNSRFICCS